MATGVERLTLYGHIAAVASVAFFSDGERLVTAGDGQTIRVYTMSVKEALRLAR